MKVFEYGLPEGCLYPKWYKKWSISLHRWKPIRYAVGLLTPLFRTTIACGWFLRTFDCPPTDIPHKRLLAIDIRIHTYIPLWIVKIGFNLYIPLWHQTAKDYEEAKQWQTS